MKTVSTVVFGLAACSLVLAPHRVVADISFVGSCSGSANNGANVTITLPTTQENDLVVVAYAIGDNDNVDFDMSLATSGYTEETDLFSNDTFDANLGVYWKFMGASPDTTVVASGLGGTDTDTIGVCMVFRGVDTTNPMDVAVTTDTALNTFNPDPPAIDHNNPAGVWTVIAGANAHNLGTGTFTFPTGYTTDAIDQVGNDTNDATVGLGYTTSPSDPEDPAVMTHSGTDSTSFAWVAATLALRPAPVIVPTVITGAAGNVSPDGATLFGNIVDDGGTAISAYGFATSTSPTLSTDVSTTTLGAGSAGPFSGSVLLNAQDSTFYYRAYATNNDGTGFGSIRSFYSGNFSITRSIRIFEGFIFKLLSGRFIVHQR